jgi:dihydroneopterin aldolase/2-amino-4-hydroxy-6-hydroxymethyldihydropteridine diphosphokinase
MTDSIVLTGIEVVATHGVLAAEKTKPQPFIVDVSIGFDLSLPGESDDLSDTIDYGKVAEEVHDFVRDHSFNLIEKLAVEIADMIIEDSRVADVSVTVHKPEAPIAVPFSDVLVTVRRCR